MEKYLVYYISSDDDDQSKPPYYEDDVVYRVNNFSELKTKIKEYVKEVEEQDCKLSWKIFKVKDIPGGNESDNKIEACFWVTQGTKDFGKFFEEIKPTDENIPLEGMSEEELQKLLTKVSNELDRRNEEKRDAAKEKLESLLEEVNKLTETFNITLAGIDEEDCCRYVSQLEVWD